MVSKAYRNNFQRKNFRNSNLTTRADLNFVNADIRGADFSYAILSGISFNNATAGLSTLWETILIIFSFILASTAGLISAYASAFIGDLLSSGINEDSFFGFASLTTLIIFLAVILYQGLSITLVVLTGVVIACLVATMAFLPTSMGTLASGAQWTALALAGVMTGFSILAVATAISRVVERFWISVLTSILAVLGALLGVLFGTNNESAYLITVGIALVIITCSIYVGWEAINTDKKYWLIQTFAIAIASQGGTRFHGATLIETNFAGATLKCTDFKSAILIRTCFERVKMFDLIRPGTTYLKSKEVRQLLLTKQGQARNFDRQDLRGVNLEGANLADASFIGADLSEANLRDADLSRAKLSQTQLDGTDFSGAILTGACIEDWGITSHTKLYGVKCEYVFMRSPTPGDPNPRRKPDNWNETFADGDFDDFIKPLVDTLDLYHNSSVDPRVIAIAFKQLAENNPDAKLEIVAMEKRGQDKFLLRAKTAPDADKSQLSAEYIDLYNQYIALPKVDLIYLLAQKDGQVKSLEIAFRAVTKGLKEVAETPKKQSTYNLQNAQFAGGLVDAETVSAQQIGGNITNYTSEQKQNLVEAAKEIEALLQHLQQTYPTTSSAEKMAVVARAVDEIEKNPTLKARVIGALKAGGTEALKDLVDHPLINILLASIEGWQEAK
ncbi:pentapeptide repeat-containing protein [Nostoc sp. FACHB-145]|uniref:pentapeptide repeat-containing protein n=1 Tax=Nostoc sp. FACHB-145 TaxID=2692836 RepID=UPI0016895BAA|nr:pentapeptide repeat-containing protein [Nostoc sp. FACHB-145]MBD2472269.1 pentapeptide repeat-containing protein [Nostoc sp. FACHB-145]